jgi:hypothetical protein
VVWRDIDGYIDEIVGDLIDCEEREEEKVL